MKKIVLLLLSTFVLSIFLIGCSGEDALVGEAFKSLYPEVYEECREECSKNRACFQDCVKGKLTEIDSKSEETSAGSGSPTEEGTTNTESDFGCPTGESGLCNNGDLVCLGTSGNTTMSCSPGACTGNYPDAYCAN
jgi:hypothetical protein